MHLDRDRPRVQDGDGVDSGEDELENIDLVEKQKLKIENEQLKNQIKNALAASVERIATVTVLADRLTEFENQWADLNSLSLHGEAGVYARLVDRLKAQRRVVGSRFANTANSNTKYFPTRKFQYGRGRSYGRGGGRGRGCGASGSPGGS